MTESETVSGIVPVVKPVPGRGVARARVWTARKELVLPAELSDTLYGRGFMPGFSDPEGKTPAMAEAGLADARFEVDGEGYRIISLTSSKGDGCHVYVRAAGREDLPDDYIARRAVPNPRFLYSIDAGGPSNSDRNLCENIAEALMVMTGGLAQIGGLGVKGNKPVLHHTAWIGAIKVG